MGALATIVGLETASEKALAVLDEGSNGSNVPLILLTYFSLIATDILTEFELRIYGVGSKRGNLENIFEEMSDPPLFSPFFHFSFFYF